MTFPQKYDVIIVGAGIAGLVALLELLDTNKKILLIDRDHSKNIGGLANWSFGGMFFVNTKIQKRAGFQDSIDLALSDWHSFASFPNDSLIEQAWAKQYVHLCTAHGYDWLQKKGVTFFPFINWAERGLTVKGNSVPRFHMVWGTGFALTQKIIQQIKGHGNFKNCSMQFGSRVTELAVSNKEVIGIHGKYEEDGSPFEFFAENTIIATGGINGSVDRVKKHWNASKTPPKTILNGAHKYAIGDLHDATENIGGAIVNLDKQWNYAAGIRHYAPRKENHGLSLVPCKSALWLNYKGERFGPTPLVTGYDTKYLVDKICESSIKYSWTILNMAIAKKEFAISGSEHNDAFRKKQFLKFLFQTLVTGNKKLVNKIIANCKDVIAADSIEDLTTQMNSMQSDHIFDPKELSNTIRAYDHEVSLGPEKSTDEQIQLIAKARTFKGDKARTCKAQQILDKTAFPLIAIRSFILSRKSLGGIQTNLNCQVLTNKDEFGKQAVISGLYAIGESAGFGGGGMHGDRSLEGTFLGGCVITARVAAADLKNTTLN